MKANNIIEINGQRYNAETGAPIGKVGKSLGRHIDSVKTSLSSLKTTQPAHKAAAKPAVKQLTTEAKAKSLSTALRQSAANVGVKPKSSQILHRSAVTKPKLEAAKPKPKVITPAPARNSRLIRAQTVPKSEAIRKFGNPASSVKTTHSQIKTGPQLAAKVPTHTEGKAQSSSSSSKESMIAASLQRAAKQHQAAKRSAQKKRRPRRVVSLASAGLAALLIAGYVSYLNVPSISLRVAAQRAGFTASLPTQKPAGYSLKGPIAYSPGQVVVNFGSNTDDRHFSITQQPSSWDSNALLENHVFKKSNQYLTYQDRGLTIYIFNGTNAAWVNNNKFYSLEGNNAQLDTDQILQLASSM